jgi:AGZA family xanthine/uracil permease-like MFS transporter
MLASVAANQKVRFLAVTLISYQHGSGYSDYLPGLPGYCGSGLLRNPTMWLGIFLGGILTAILMLYRIKGALLIGITIVAIISWPRDTAVTAFPHNTIGDANFAFFKKVVTFDPLSQIGNVLDVSWSVSIASVNIPLTTAQYGGYGSGRVWYALVTFLYVDILDTTGTLYSMAKFAGLRDPITGDFEHSIWAYCIDGLCISLGSLMGTPPVTAFIESATGISEGGKTGLTAVAAGMMFLVSVFFAPIFASIPSWATGGSLIIVGMLMARKYVCLLLERSAGVLNDFFIACETSTGTMLAMQFPLF